MGLFILVFAGNFLSQRLQNPAAIEALLLFNAVLLGIAVFFTTAIYTLFLHRVLFHNFPRADVMVPHLGVKQQSNA